MLDRTKSIGEKLVHWLGGIEAHVMTVMRYHVMTEELGPRVTTLSSKSKEIQTVRT